jgi:two-component SAPR family response regulator
MRKKTLNETKTLNLLLVSREKGSLSGLVSALKKHDDVILSWSESGGEALDKISNSPVDLFVTDEKLGDMTGLELALKLLSINPMVNCAAISPLSHEDFHEASEGLGLLAQLPSQPGEKEAEELIQQLRELKNLTDGSLIP